MSLVDFLTPLHKATKRDYVARVTEFPKAEAARVAKQYGAEYWDGDRKFGYGGYRYDGRHRVVAEAMAKHYGLQPGQRVLDVGCGKAFLLYEFTQVVPGIEVVGIDTSDYALQHAKEEVRPLLRKASATHLPFPDGHFDLVYSIMTLHNLPNFDLHSALREMQRVGKKHRYVYTESYRTEEEKVNLLYWQLTCASFYTPQEWEWFFKLAGFEGDYAFAFFE